MSVLDIDILIEIWESENQVYISFSLHFLARPRANRQKNSLRECVFVNSALKLNTLLQTAFSAILPTGDE